MTLDFIGADSNTIIFGTPGSTLMLDDASSFTGILIQLAVGDIIDMPGVSPAGQPPRVRREPL
jgi:hypothetical protein